MNPSPEALHLVDPKSLAAERLQVHFAIRTLASAAHALREHAEDDSHSNLGLTPHGIRMFTHPLTAANDRQLGLELPALRLCVFDRGIEGESLQLEGVTLEEAHSWAGEVLGFGGPVPRREFPDFPEHGLAGEGHFHAGNAQTRTVLAQWFAVAERGLKAALDRDERAGVHRIWPHHFDLGCLVDLGEGRGVGLGLSPGDALFEQPYLYAYAFPTPAAYRPFDGPRGRLHTEGFHGYVLLGEELLEGEHPDKDAEIFFRHALSCAETSLG